MSQNVKKGELRDRGAGDVAQETTSLLCVRTRAGSLYSHEKPNTHDSLSVSQQLGGRDRASWSKLAS